MRFPCSKLLWELILWPQMSTACDLHSFQWGGGQINKAVLTRGYSLERKPIQMSAPVYIVAYGISKLVNVFHLQYCDYGIVVCVIYVAFDTITWGFFPSFIPHSPLQWGPKLAFSICLFFPP